MGIVGLVLHSSRWRDHRRHHRSPGKERDRESDGALGGDGMATIGLVLGYSQLALILCICVLAIILVPALFAGVWTFGN
jgi:hypothetical protein